jgi:hypothetical protein
MKNKSLINLIGAVGILIFFIGVYLTIAHHAYGTRVQFLGVGILACVLGPAVISKSYDLLIRKKGGIDQKE